MGKKGPEFFFSFSPRRGEGDFWAGETSANAPCPRHRVRRAVCVRLIRRASRRFLRPVGADDVETRTFPRVARRRKRRRCTRGYIPPPRWGENGSSPFPACPPLHPAACRGLVSVFRFPVPSPPTCPPGLRAGSRRPIPRHAGGLFPFSGTPLPVPGPPFPPLHPPACRGFVFPIPDSRLHFTLCLCTIACCEKTTLSTPRQGCEKSNAVSVFRTHQGMYMTTAPKRRKKSKTLSSSIKTGLKSVKFGTLLALPILTFHPSNPSGASARAVLTLQKGQKGGAPF